MSVDLYAAFDYKMQVYTHNSTAYKNYGFCKSGKLLHVPHFKNLLLHLEVFPWCQHRTRHLAVCRGPVAHLVQQGASSGGDVVGDSVVSSQYHLIHVSSVSRVERSLGGKEGRERREVRQEERGGGIDRE